MKTALAGNLLAAALLGALAFTATPARAADPLPSWNDGKARQAIVTFVEKTTKAGSPDFVPAPERIAVFDNDGTLWAEQPVYFQLEFARRRAKGMLEQNPALKSKQPFKKLLATSRDTKVHLSTQELFDVVMATHANMTSDEFDASVASWIATARHPDTGRLYTEMVYQPMLELLAYLRANGFKTYIVSGGGIEFMRVFAEKLYGVPPEQVIGSSIKTKYEVRDGKPVIVRLPELNFIDDQAGKPVGIHTHIGRRPIFAAGNSDGDFEMLEWTTSGSGARFALIVHHTDSKREWAYDRESHVGRLDKALNEAPKRGWSVVDMKRDWKAIYPGGQ